MSGAMNRHCIPGFNYVHSRSGELLCGSVRGIIKTMHTEVYGFTRTRIALCQRPGADTEETGRYDLAWKDLCSVLNALSK